LGGKLPLVSPLDLVRSSDLTGNSQHNNYDSYDGEVIDFALRRQSA
jgi:hypothetical protein